MSDRIGVMFAPERPLRDLIAFAQQAQSAGVHELWLAEDCFLHGGLTAATAVLARTDDLSLGVGLLPTTVRNPAIVAMEIATIATLFPGRLQVGFGHGVEAWMQQIGARPRNRIDAMRQVVGAVRGLLHGQTVDLHTEDVTLHDVRLDHPPEEPPPILIGTTGPRAIALAAEIADGVILPEGAGPAMVATVRQATTVYTWFRVDEDGDAARTVVLEQIRAWRDAAGYPLLAAHAQLPATGEIGADAVARLAVAGTPEQCVKAIRGLHEAGAASVVLRPVGPGLDQQIDALRAKILRP